MRGNGRMIQNYEGFITALGQAGFSMGSNNDEGVFSLYSRFGDSIHWHTGDPETDPWEWRMRVLNERDDIAYAKLFFNKSGYITKEWYPYFLAVRRGGLTFEEEYLDGTISYYAKRVYHIIQENSSLPTHRIKKLGGFSKDDNSAVERALVELQMKMYITMCGHTRKVNQAGEEYGWYSSVFCTTESFFGNEVFELEGKIREQEAFQRISEQIYRLNPAADAKRIEKFIKG
jgi:hypothetical protein